MIENAYITYNSSVKCTDSLKNYLLMSDKNDNEHPQLFTVLFSLCMDYPSPPHPLPYSVLRHKQLFLLYDLLPWLSSLP